MYIVCSTDNNFVQHCIIMLVSLLSNNSNVEIFIISDNLSENNINKIKEEVTTLNGIVSFFPVSEEISNKFPMSKMKGLNHISRATYYRLLIPELLPKTIHKAIYLDCDIVINSSIKELWNINLTNYAIAAVLQIGSGKEAERLDYPIEYGYFNAGVTLINLDYFRNNNICNKLMEYIHKYPEKLLYNDQDVLNAVLYNKCYHLLPQWNMTSLCYTPGLQHRGDLRNKVLIRNYDKEKNNIKKFKKHPPILHFVSRPKPWQRNCVHPLYNLYYTWAKKTIHYKNIQKQGTFSRTIAIIKYNIRVYLSNIKQSIYKTDLTRL